MNAPNYFNEISGFHFNYVIIWLHDLKQIVFYVTVSFTLTFVFFKDCFYSASKILQQKMGFIPQA